MLHLEKDFNIKMVSEPVLSKSPAKLFIHPNHNILNALAGITAKNNVAGSTKVLYASRLVFRLNIVFSVVFLAVGIADHVADKSSFIRIISRILNSEVHAKAIVVKQSNTIIVTKDIGIFKGVLAIVGHNFLPLLDVKSCSPCHGKIMPEAREDVKENLEKDLL